MTAIDVLSDTNKIDKYKGYDMSLSNRVIF